MSSILVAVGNGSAPCGMDCNECLRYGMWMVKDFLDLRHGIPYRFNADSSTAWNAAITSEYNRSVSQDLTTWYGKQRGVITMIARTQVFCIYLHVYCVS